MHQLKAIAGRKKIDVNFSIFRNIREHIHASTDFYGISMPSLRGIRERRSSVEGLILDHYPKASLVAVEYDKTVARRMEREALRGMDIFDGSWGSMVKAFADESFDFDFIWADYCGGLAEDDMTALKRVFNKKMLKKKAVFAYTYSLNPRIKTKSGPLKMLTTKGKGDLLVGFYKFVAELCEANGYKIVSQEDIGYKNKGAIVPARTLIFQIERKP